MRIIVGLCALTSASSAWANSMVFQWTGGNDHYYERIDTTGTLSYDDAATAASAQSYLGMQGQLAAFEGNSTAYVAERDFVFTNVYNAAPAPTTSRTYWIGAASSTGNQADWTWITGSAVPVTGVTDGWFIDHNEGAGREGASFFQTSNTQVFDYKDSDPTTLVSGYIVEFVPEPASTIFFLAPLAVAALRRQNRPKA